MFKNKIWVSFLFLFLVGAFLQSISQPFLEEGIYITEQQDYSFETGSTYRLLFLHGVFFGTLIFLLNYLPMNSNFQVVDYKIKGFIDKRKIYFFLIFFLFVSSFVLVFNAIISPSPIFNDGINRFNFWDHAELPFLKYIYGERSTHVFIIIGYLLFYYLIFYPHKVKLIFFIGFVYFLYQYMLGEKFTAQLIAFGYILPSFITYVYIKHGCFRILFNKKVIIRILLFLFFSFLVVYFYYSNKYTLTERTGSALSAIYYRLFILQGHTSWGVDLSTLNNGSLGFLEGLNIVNIYNGDLMKYAMLLIAPQEIYNHFIDSNVRFSSASPTIFVKVFGWGVTILLLIVYAFIVYFVINRALYFLMKTMLIPYFCYMLILYYLFVIYNMGDLSIFFYKKFIMSFFVIIIVELFYLSAVVIKDEK